MYISRIKLVNWKNFQLCDISLPLRAFVIGANATGKSNFLDAFRFLRDIVKQGGGLQSAVEERGGVKKIRCLSARTHNNVRIEVFLAEETLKDDIWHYIIEFKNVGGGIVKNQAMIVHESLYNIINKKFAFQRSPKDEENAEQLLYTYIEQPMATENLSEVRDAFRSMEYLNVIPELVRSADSYVLSSGKEDYFGRNFLRRMATLNGNTRNKYLRLINDVLKVAVPQIENLTFEKDEKGVPHIVAKYKHWRALGARQDEKVFSDGTLRLIGFLFALLDGNGVILLEEPETNLHLGIVKQIPEFIAHIQQEKPRQVIITTHSYEILSNEGISSDEIIVLSPGIEGTEVYVGTTSEEIMNMLNAGFSVAEAVIPLTEPHKIESINKL